VLLYDYLELFSGDEDNTEDLNDDEINISIGNFT
jgi:hypothetical protein